MCILESVKEAVNKIQNSFNWYQMEGFPSLFFFFFLSLNDNSNNQLLFVLIPQLPFGEVSFYVLLSSVSKTAPQPSRR